MYYDRFGRSLTSASIPASIPASAPVRQERATPAAHADSATLKTFLDTHRTVWHHDSLRELAPEILDYLESRYAAARRPAGLLVRAVDGSYPDLELHGEQRRDQREIADVLLSREYRQALFAEHIIPAIDRLSA